MSKIFKSSPETGIKFHLHIHIPNRTRLIDFLRFMWPLLDDNFRPNFQFSVFWPWGTTDTRLEIPTVRPPSRQPSSFKTLKSSSLFLLFCHLLALTQHTLPQLWSRSCIIVQSAAEVLSELFRLDLLIWKIKVQFSDLSVSFFIPFGKILFQRLFECWWIYWQ